MKIGLIGHKGIPGVSGGVERHVEEIGRRMAERGHDVIVYNRRGYTGVRTGTHAGMRLKRIFTVNGKNTEALIYSLLAAIRSVFDRRRIVHFHAEGPALMSFIPRIFGKKVITTIHGLDWERAKWGRAAKAYLKLAEAVAVRCSHRIIVVSGVLKRYIDAKYGARAAAKTVYIANGINPPETLPASRITEKFGLERGAYVLFLSRLSPEKGCHYLLEAFKGIRGGVRLAIAGGSSHSDGYCASLERYASSDIIFTGEVRGEVLKELYGNAICFVLPSEVEGQPIVLLEAMSCGLCPLVSDIPENLEVVTAEDGSMCGFSFTSADPGSLREKLQYMLDHPDETREAGNRARELALRKFDWDRSADATEQIYRAAVS